MTYLITNVIKKKKIERVKEKKLKEQSTNLWQREETFDGRSQTTSSCMI